MKRDSARATFTIISIALIWLAVAVPSPAQPIPGIGTVMTYNVNEGTDFAPKAGALLEPIVFSDQVLFT
jgi:hypothetical protein